MNPFPTIDDQITGMERYWIARHYIGTADAIEWRSDAFFPGGAIRARTGMDVNHTSMAFRFLMEGDTEVRIKIAEATAHGIRPDFLSDSLDGYQGKAYLVRCLLSHKDRLKIAREMQAFERNGSAQQVRYDYRSIVRMLIKPRVKVDGSRMFCSEAIHVAAINAGIISERENQGIAVVPGELHLLGIYEARSFRIY